LTSRSTFCIPWHGSHVESCKISMLVIRPIINP
jgi:hypothetical protein